MRFEWLPTLWSTVTVRWVPSTEGSSAKLGAPKAIVAMCTSSWPRLIYRMIKFGQEYIDKGKEAYEAKYRETAATMARKSKPEN